MSIFSDPEMQEIFEGFLVETNELLESISTDLVEIENNPQDIELINKLFRSFHTIKGTASFMGFSAIAEITHHAEDILNKLRHSELAVSQEIIDVLLEVQDWIVMLIDKVESGDSSPIDFSLTIEKINVLKTGGSLKSNNKTETKNTENWHDEFNSRAVDVVLSSPDLVQGEDHWTAEELRLIDAAFNDVNSDFWQEQQHANNDDNIDKEEEINEDKQSIDISENNTQNEENLSNTAVLYSENEDNTIGEQSQPNQVISSEPSNIVSEAQSANSNATTQATFPQITTTTSPTTKMVSKSSADTTIRVDVGRVEAILDLSGELVLNRNR